MIRFFITMIWYSILSMSAVTFAQLSTIDHTSPSITQSIDHVVDTNNISNPLRQGTRFFIESPDGNNILDVMNISEIRWFDQAQNETLHLIRNIINIILSFTAVVVLILLLILGIAQTIRMLTTMFAWWVEDLKELIDRIKRLRNKDKKEETEWTR